MDKNTENNLLKEAFEVAGKTFSREEIFEILKSDEDFKKPVAILNLENILSQEEASVLINHLTGVDGRIREASANKTAEFLSGESFELFLDENSVNTILNGIMDINPNVGRVLIEGIKSCPEIQKLILPKLIEKINELIKKLKTFSDTLFKENKLNDKRNHAKNKVVFNLYWALETVSRINFCKQEEEIIKILNFTSCYTDYTIREKSAKILSRMDKPPKELLKKLKEDENFYVKNQLL